MFSPVSDSLLSKNKDKVYQDVDVDKIKEALQYCIIQKLDKLGHYENNEAIDRTSAEYVSFIEFCIRLNIWAVTQQSNIETFFHELEKFGFHHAIDLKVSFFSQLAVNNIDIESLINHVSLSIGDDQISLTNSTSLVTGLNYGDYPTVENTRFLFTTNNWMIPIFYLSTVFMVSDLRTIVSGQIKK